MQKRLSKDYEDLKFDILLFQDDVILNSGFGIDDPIDDYDDNGDQF